MLQLKKKKLTPYQNKILTISPIFSTTSNTNFLSLHIKSLNNHPHLGHKANKSRGTQSFPICTQFSLLLFNSTSFVHSNLLCSFHDCAFKNQTLRWWSLPRPFPRNGSTHLSRLPWWGFAGGSVGKESDCNAGDSGSIPGWGRSPGGGNDNPLQYSCLGNFMDRRTWRVTVHGVAESQTRLSNWTHTHNLRKNFKPSGSPWTLPWG